MKLPIKLQELLQQSDESIASISRLMAVGNAWVDCSDVEVVADDKLALLLSEIPTDWDIIELSEVIDADTLSDSLAEQIVGAIDLRLGRVTVQSAPTFADEDEPSKTLDIFNLRDEVIEDYRTYIESFLKIRDPKVEAFVQNELDKGELWPDSLVQLNPSYKPGAYIHPLIAEGLLHPDCARYFPDYVSKYPFRYHQEQAFRVAHRQEPYVLTTGTGSGKSMTYVVPIIDDILRNPQIQGVRAILVYPMNALINSQKQEFDKFLGEVGGTHIRVEQYTGQENLAQKTSIQQNPPQIILTNYVMLELMLSRTHEEKLVGSQDLKFLVLDELHTYRGRQGADVAILVRKLRQRCGQNLLCIGTSATMSTEGTRDDRRQTVAKVASKLFGIEVKAYNVIDETLERSIPGPIPIAEVLRDALLSSLPHEETQTLVKEAFQGHPLAAWIEMAFGLEDEEGHLVRRTPISLSQGASQLSEITQVSLDTCQDMLRRMFLWGSKTGGLAFRLHQFISQGGSVYSTAEPANKRELTLEGQYATTEKRLLYPLVFCRECGQDYYLVYFNREQDQIQPLLPTQLTFNPDNADIQEGYLTLNEPGLWNESEADRLPDTWFKETKRDGRVPKKEYAPFIPQRLRVLPDGKITTSLLSGTEFWFSPKPFTVCLHCGVVHDRRKSEFTKLSRLSSEGRSTATTLLCLSTVNRLKSSDAVKPTAQKVLSFTDNRQDASLQAGHFNDFVQTSLLRASLNGALTKQKRLTHTDLVKCVIQQMNLPQEVYARQASDIEGPGKRRNERAFQKLVEYRLYEDLRKGWRFVQPNLEQCGLLAIQYEGIDEVCASEQLWERHPHPLLRQATPQQRCDVVKALLNQLRKDLVLDAVLLQPANIDQLLREVNQAIADPWCFDAFERLHEARWATTTPNGTRKVQVKLTARSKIGRFLRSERAWPWLNQPISEDDYSRLIHALVTALADAGYFLQEENRIQLRVDSLQWIACKATHISPDPMTSRRLQGSEDSQIRVNQFFQDFYERSSSGIHTFEGREHTGQVRNEKRQEREAKFRDGKLATLFCSPTMELGIDIADLNVVHMRNVPPSPANYAQRSGRAGRSGQAAIVITYASIGSGHDQYFFKRQDQMVAGVVVPPKLELGNQDLIRSHVHSIWLAHTDLFLENSMNQVLDLDLDSYPLKETVRNQLTLTSAGLDSCFQAVKSILSDWVCQEDLTQASWYSEDWLRYTLDTALNSFDRACNRWRNLYIDAVTQLNTARQVIDRSAKGNVTQEDRNNAEALEKEARRQVDLLVGRVKKGSSQTQFEFYPYRYFAAEGFLPGYNFPRLPVRTYVQSGEEGEFIARPRVVAIREFAPGNILYYEGNKFQIAKTRIPVGGIDAAYQRVALCPTCGYFHDGDNSLRELCENCGSRLGPDSQGNPAKVSRLLTMETMLTRRRERITCDEEERLKYGYNITTHFRYSNGRKQQARVHADDGTKLMDLTFGETAKIWRINRGLTRSQEKGFKLDLASGRWGENIQDKEASMPESLHTEVHLLVDDTCNVLLVEPTQVPTNDGEAFLASFQYALQRAIQAVYKLEDDELASERLGQGKHMLFWEASEGGAGVISQILENPESFQRLATEALDICHFNHEKENCSQACYECLLSYRNQFDHPLLNRYLIKSWLEKLITSQVCTSSIDTDSRLDHYQLLRSQTDPNSELERQVLDEIFQRGIQLPDSAQLLVEAANCKPDFVYIEKKIAIFCDGSVHDHPERQEQDQIDRDNLKYSAGYHVLTLKYSESWQSKLAILASLLG
ncbi:DEAD/DEAH box helicase [Halomicronema sp. CCY15110]|uniref:DEAD/DEAH box helicase n=1 Tax=Halomicronema sp. CCY15110 TaxID=2767773 RepID=UPI001EF2AA21|nr:DEAD/DEAH box helicase [Halomicronema sp. CCY15110]